MPKKDAVLAGLMPLMAPRGKHRLLTEAEGVEMVKALRRGCTWVQVGRVVRPDIKQAVTAMNMLGAWAKRYARVD